ncbi:MAG: hypothetical protein H0V70_11980 [Ktedonobacteraceae bacterium]|nr:hypothetical protein [Ktedonobacteraceae bacterium]
MFSKKSLRLQDIAVSRHTLQIQARSRSYTVVRPAVPQKSASLFILVPEETSLPILIIHGTSDPIVPYNGGVASLWGLNPRGLGLSARETAHYYALRNHIDAQSTTRALEPEGKNVLKVTFEEYKEAGKYPVTLVSIKGGGHVVPNPYKKAAFLVGKMATHVNSAELLWNFFYHQDFYTPDDLP